jgi:hypothetical protein
MTNARLLACPSCARHVRVSERACVFCGRALSASFGDEQALPRPRRMNRDGLFHYRARALAASTAALLAASCGGALEGGAADGGSDADHGEDSSYRDSSFGDVSFTGAYGLAPPEDASLRPIYDGGAPDAEPNIDSSLPDATSPDSASQDAADHDVNYALPYGVAPQP